jgi:hypothetical protein
MKGIGNKRQNVYPFFLDTWRIMQEHSDQTSLECFIFVVMYEDMLYYSIKVSFGGH